MIKCSEDCINACDFCIHISVFGKTGIGKCNKHGHTTSVGYSCEDFYCFRAKTIDELVEESLDKHGETWKAMSNV